MKTIKQFSECLAGSKKFHLVKIQSINQFQKLRSHFLIIKNLAVKSKKNEFLIIIHSIERSKFS